MNDFLDKDACLWWYDQEHLLSALVMETWLEPT